MDDHLEGTGWFSAPNRIFELDHPHDILIGAYLCRKAGPDGSSYPSLQSIARACKISKASVKRALARLEAGGWLMAERRTNEKGEPVSNLFTLTGLRVSRVGSGRPHLGSQGTDRWGQGEPLSTTHIEVQPTEGLSTSALASLRVAFAPEGFTVPPQLIEQWRTAYPALDVEREVRAAHAWAVANPANRKSNWTRFLVNWLARSQERAPRVRDRDDQTMDERARELARR